MKHATIAILSACLIVVWIGYEKPSPNTVIAINQYKHCCHYETTHGQTIADSLGAYQLGDTIHE